MHREIIKGSLWAFGGNGLQQLLQFGIFLILARHLQPDAFGYVALAAALIESACPIVRWGIVELVLQRHKCSPSMLFHAFVLSLAIGVALTALLLLGIALYSHTEGSSIVTDILLWLAPIILLQAAETVPDAIVRKNLNFRWLAIRSNAAALIGGGAALLCLALDMNLYALVFQRLASVAAITVLIWVAAVRYSKFYLPHRLKAQLFWQILRSGAQIVSTSIAGALGPRIMDGIIGYMLGAQALGFFKISWRIFEFVIQLALNPVVNVAQATLPKLVSNPQLFESTYRQFIIISSLGVFPLLAGLAISVTEWVPLLIGKQWVAAEVPIQLICGMGFASVINSSQSPLLLALKQNKLLLYQGLGRVLMITALAFIGSFFDLVTVVALLSANAFIYAFYNMIVIKKLKGWSLADGFLDMVPASVASFCMALVIWLAEGQIKELPPVYILLLKICLGVAVYAAVLLLLYRGKLKGLLKLYLKKT